MREVTPEDVVRLCDFLNNKKPEEPADMLPIANSMFVRGMDPPLDEKWQKVYERLGTKPGRRNMNICGRHIKVIKSFRYGAATFDISPATKLELMGAVGTTKIASFADLGSCRIVEEHEETRFQSGFIMPAILAHQTEDMPVMFRMPVSEEKANAYIKAADALNLGDIGPYKIISPTVRQILLSSKMVEDETNRWTVVREKTQHVMSIDPILPPLKTEEQAALLQFIANIYGTSFSRGISSVDERVSITVWKVAPLFEIPLLPHRLKLKSGAEVSLDLKKEWVKKFIRSLKGEAYSRAYQLSRGYAPK